MHRIWQAILVVTFVPLSWLMMMTMHELGHVLGASLTGGRVVEVHLHPMDFSYTFVDPNPRPLVVAWMGSIAGAVLPLLLLPIGWIGHGPIGGLLRWFAGFCLIANGAYLGVGWMDGVGDAGDLLHHGAAAWQLILFGTLTVPTGLLLWHRTGPAFGLSTAQGIVHPAAALTSTATLVVVVAIMFSR